MKLNFKEFSMVKKENNHKDIIVISLFIKEVFMMSFWKVLGGVATGVSAVAAAPFTGGGSIILNSSVGCVFTGRKKAL